VKALGALFERPEGSTREASSAGPPVPAEPRDETSLPDEPTDQPILELSTTTG
jgi:hypothetical protein